MKDHWYCQVESEQFGPFTWEQMRAMAAEGRLVPESQVRREAGERWLAAGKVPGLLNTPKPVPSSSQNGQRADGAAVADDSSQKLKVARPNQPKAAAPAAPSTRAGEPTPPPPPVIKSGISRKAPLPEPAANASPLGIVVAPPVASAARGSKPAGALDLSAVVEKDAHGLSPLLVGGVLGGVALVLLAVGGGAVAWQMSQKADAQAALAKAAAIPSDDKPAISEAELDAILGPIKPPEPAPPKEQPKPAEAPQTAEATAAADATAALTNATDPKAAAARKLVAAQTRWTPIEGVVIRGRDIEVEVAQIWLANDEKGTRVDPVLPTTAPAASGVLTPPAATSSQGKYIFVDVRVSNRGTIPRKYTSWNMGGNVTAILADATGEPLAFVPPEDTPSVTRLKSLHIPADQMIGDILVFEAPAEPFESLKLLLSQAAFGAAGRNFALDVPVEFLFKEAEGLPPQTALAADDDAPAKLQTRPAKKRVDPNAPPSLENFTEELAKDKKTRDTNATDDPPQAPKPRS